ncbi:MAG: helix-turn-helix transcriptional regulator [Chloroflexi bacterium]|nr:helix-turn-helix transcriptional regulator [Chloroflexota bacterium]
MSQSIFDLQAQLCHTMANAARLRIVHCLREGPRSVGEIAAATGYAQPKVSQHLALLRNHGIVSAKRQGSEIIYQIASPKIVRVCDLMREVLAEQAAERSELVLALQSGK